MLQFLHIENYALIRTSDITFHPGMTVITGETGAGKSIILGALGLLLGQRADTQVLQDKDRKCVVEAHFDISGLGLQPIFEQHDAEYDDHLILRREILPSAKSRAFVNDSPATLPLLRDLADHILDIHSQYQTLTLTESTFQTQLLDSFDPASPLTRYQTLYRQYTHLKQQLEQLTAQDAENSRQHDYNQFLFDELQAAHLQPDEQPMLEEELQLLEHTETIKQALAAVLALCDNGDNGDSAVARLVESRSQLAHINSYHTDIDALHQRLDSSIIELQDILAEVGSIDDRMQYSPERQAAVAERLDLIYRLQKKHQTDSIPALLDIQQQLDAKLQEAESLDDRIHQLMEQVDAVFASLQQQADLLTASRRQGAALLEQQIHPILADLGMAAASVMADIQPSEHYGPLGHDIVRLLFNANAGGTPRPLGDVASGGELSRLMLAVKAVVTQRSLLPTIIFDEIDSGISGDISVAVGGIMQRMARHTQLIAISHLPQIAAKAHQHLKVAKALEQERTVSHIRPLSDDERITEIAIMLSSNPPTSAALQTARELMGPVICNL